MVSTRIRIVGKTFHTVLRKRAYPNPTMLKIILKKMFVTKNFEYLIFKAKKQYSGSVLFSSDPDLTFNFDSDPASKPDPYFTLLK